MSLHLLVLVILGALMRHTNGFWGKPPLRGTGLAARIYTSFTGTDNLGTHSSSLKYVYIIARHGMVVPTDETYPTDWHYKGKWKKDRFTTHGRRMMTRLGRSLATRYKQYIDAATIQKVKVTTMNTDYGEQNALELLDGLLPGETNHRVERSDMDKFRLLKSPDACKSYKTLKDKAMITEKRGNKEIDFFDKLNRHIGVTVNSKSKWYIDSNQRVYNLWEIMDFERKSKQWSPWWFEQEKRERMRDIVNQYLFDSIHKYYHMPMLVGGRIFKEMLDEIANKEIKMHIHITNDFTYAAFKDILLNCGIRAPEFGETLMMEMDSIGTTIVHTYRPYRKNQNYEMDLKFDETEATRSFSDIENQVRTRYGITNKLNEGVWKEICNDETSVDPLTIKDFPQLHSAASVPPMSPQNSRSGSQSETAVRLPPISHAPVSVEVSVTQMSPQNSRPGSHSETTVLSPIIARAPVTIAVSVAPRSTLNLRSGGHSEPVVGTQVVWGYPTTDPVPPRPSSFDALPSAPSPPIQGIRAMPLRDADPTEVTVRHP